MEKNIQRRTTTAYLIDVFNKKKYEFIERKRRNDIKASVILWSLLGVVMCILPAILTIAITRDFSNIETPPKPKTTAEIVDKMNQISAASLVAVGVLFESIEKVICFFNKSAKIKDTTKNRIHNAGAAILLTGVFSEVIILPAVEILNSKYQSASWINLSMPLTSITVVVICVFFMSRNTETLELKSESAH